MTADVQTWLDDAGTKFGWRLIGKESKGKTANRFDTMESSESARPTLTIEFTPYRISFLLWLADSSIQRRNFPTSLTLETE